jgi:hypothetical protein
MMAPEKSESFAKEVVRRQGLEPVRFVTEIQEIQRLPTEQGPKIRRTSFPS